MRAEAFQVLRRKPVQVSPFLLTLTTFGIALCLQHELSAIKVNLVVLLGQGYSIVDVDD
jgi:hypothetical protein